MAAPAPDGSAGVWVVRNRFEPGVRLQPHRHTGPVDGFTIAGRWHYLEYDFFSTPGSYIRPRYCSRVADH